MLRVQRREVVAIVLAMHDIAQHAFIRQKGNPAPRQLCNKMKNYVILSVERRAPLGYFVAIHGYSPFYSTLDKAHRFPSKEDAEAYGNKELFTTRDAFVVRPVTTEAI